LKDHLAIYSKIICHGWCGFIISCWWQKLQRLLSFVLYSHVAITISFLSFNFSLKRFFLHLCLNYSFYHVQLMASRYHLFNSPFFDNWICLNVTSFLLLWLLSHLLDQTSLFNIWFYKRTISIQKCKLLNKTPIYYLYYSSIHTLNWKLFGLETCIESQ
jgi:hypothetical protein